MLTLENVDFLCTRIVELIRVLVTSFTMQVHASDLIFVKLNLIVVLLVSAEFILLRELLLLLLPIIWLYGIRTELTKSFLDSVTTVRSVGTYCSCLGPSSSRNGRQQTNYCAHL